MQQHEIDRLLLQVIQLEKLYKFKPDAVDLVIAQIKIEADLRRTETSYEAKYRRRERLIGQVSLPIIGLSGIFGGLYVITQGQSTTGGIISSLAIVGFAAVFFRNNRYKR